MQKSIVKQIPQLPIVTLIQQASEIHLRTLQEIITIRQLWIALLITLHHSAQLYVLPT